MVICGVDPRVHYCRREKNLYDASLTIEEMLPQAKNTMSRGKHLSDGAWVYKKRFRSGHSRIVKVFCRNRVFGITQQKLDLVTVFDDVFTMGEYKSVVHMVDDITTCHNINQSGVAARSIAHVMVHG